MLCLYVERCFERLTCWVDLCLSNLLVAFIFMCFSSLEKPLFFKLDRTSTDTSTECIKPLCFAPDRFSITGRSIEIFFWPLYLLDKSLTHSRSIEISGFLLDRTLIASQSNEMFCLSFCLFDTFFIDLRSIELMFLSSTTPWQFASVEI